MNRAIAIVVSLILVVTAYCAFFHYQGIHHYALMWDRVSGDYWLEKKASFHFSMPWVMAAKIDNRPMRVCVTSASRSFNCRLVQFVPSAYKEFIQTEGFRYYWWANRISFNFGYDEEYRGMKDILRGYTFSAKKYLFIDVVKEYE